MRAGILIIAALSCAAISAASCTAPALPPVSEVSATAGSASSSNWAEAYGGAEEAAALLGFEETAAAIITQRLKAQDAAPCPFTQKLSTAAREHAVYLLDKKDSDTVDPSRLLNSLRRYGAVDFIMAPAAISFSPVDEERVKKAADILAERAASEKHIPGPFRCGIGMASRGDTASISLVKVFRPVLFEPVPSSPEPGSTIVLTGSMLSSDREIEVILGYPDGTTARVSPRIRRKTFSAEIRLKENPGVYDLELVTFRNKEPLIAFLAPLYVGIAVPGPETERLTPPSQDEEDASVAASVLFELINESRMNMGLEPLKRNAQLDEIALSHCMDMAENEFVGHVSEKTGALADRLHARGLSPSVSSENVGRSSMTRRIHGNFMSSPAHRANILDPDVEETGIGVVKMDSDLIVTEIFVRW